MSRSVPPPDERTLAADSELFEIEREIDWLARLSPLDNAARWRAFERSGFREAPRLTYPPFDLDTSDVRRRLADVRVDEIDQPTIRVLLGEKQNELERQLTLLDARDTPAFTTASLALFGGSDAALLADAIEILTTVPERGPTGPSVGADAVVEEAEAARARYRQIAPDFDFAIHLVADADAALVVHHGDLQVDRRIEIPAARVAALVAHEVGVHVVTRYNGRRQPLRLFESGFAHYDILQEGLATFCEYLSGCLPAARLRVLAARVVAADLAVRDASLEKIFESLHRDHGLAAGPAFDVAVRAKRGGGLTKDAVYLGGLRDLHAWLNAGGDITQLFLGKYSLRQRHLVTDLLDVGFLVPAAVLPTCLTGPDARDRLAAALATPLTALYQTEFPT